MGQEEQGPLHGHVPAPLNEAVEQTNLQKSGEGLVFSFLNIAANEVPILGSVLTELRSSRMQHYMEGRIADLAEALRGEMQAVEEGVIDKEYLNSEAFFDLLLQAVDTAARTRDRRKIELVAQILRGAILQGAEGEYSPEEYLRLVSDLTVTELRVSRSLYAWYSAVSAKDRDELWEQWKNAVCADVGIDEADLAMVLSRMSSKGLIEPVFTGADERGLWIDTAKPGEIRQHVISLPFKKLMRFLRTSP